MRFDYYRLDHAGKRRIGNNSGAATRLSGVKIIAISGGSRHSSADYLKMATAFGAQQVLAKPFSRQEILTAINEVLES